jgi:hypothetical protein
MKLTGIVPEKLALTSRKLLEIIIFTSQNRMERF